MLAPGYDKVPKHASIACRQLADFIGSETRSNSNKKKIEKKIYGKLFMPSKIFIQFAVPYSFKKKTTYSYVTTNNFPLYNYAMHIKYQHLYKFFVGPS